MKSTEGELTVGSNYDTQFRRIAIQLHHDLGLGGQPRSVLLATPSQENEESCIDSGLMLARCLGDDLGQPVLAVDVSPGDPELSRRLGCEQSPGFSDVILDDRRKLEDLVLATNSPNLFLLPAGQTTGRVLSDSLPQFLEKSLKAFSFLVLFGGAVFDNPTVLALAPHSGIVLLFAVDNETPRHSIDQAHESLVSCKAQRVAMILTTAAKT